MDPALLSLLLHAWARSFLFTLAVEVPVYAVVTRGVVPRGRAMLAGAAGTCLTHPLLWFVWPRVIADHDLGLASGEALVALVETCTFLALARPVPFRWAVAAAFLANAASWGLGWGVRAWLPGILE